MNEKNLLSNNKLQTAFKMFDKDGGGSISTDEIKQVLSFGQNLDEAVVQQIIEQVDKNGDGEISYEEFAAMMLKNIQDWWESTIFFYQNKSNVHWGVRTRDYTLSLLISLIRALPLEKINTILNLSSF